MMLMFSSCSAIIATKPDETDGSFDLSFREEDLDASYQIDGSTYISLGNEDIRISKSGTYILEGTLNGSVIVEAGKNDDVQLVLNNVTIDAGDFAGIYIIEADQVKITLVQDSINTISDDSVYVQIDSNDVDALIYSKADLLINGTGSLNLISSYNHGIVSKDDLIIAGAVFNIDVAGQGIRGKDCVRIMDGHFSISSGKDAIKSDNEEDAYRGYVYIASGSFDIDTKADGIYGYSLVAIAGGSFDITTEKSDDADSYKAIKSDGSIDISDGNFIISSIDDGIHSNGDIHICNASMGISSLNDGIHADGLVQIDDGMINIDASEGIEGTYVLINDGEISISAKDDGINAAQKSGSYTPTVEINGGYIKIVMAQGDTDGIDSNGCIYINGGTVDITGQFAFDYDTAAEYNGGTIIVNGVETDEITNQFADGAFGGMQRPEG